MANDGGPAFPSEQGHTPFGTWNQTYESGMTLRDWFAGQALIGIATNPGGLDTDTGEWASLAYHVADKMLAERMIVRK